MCWLALNSKNLLFTEGDEEDIESDQEDEEIDEDVESDQEDEEIDAVKTEDAEEEEEDDDEDVEVEEDEDNEDEKEEDDSVGSDSTNGIEDREDIDTADVKDVDWNYWSDMIEHAIKNMSKIPRNAKQLLQKPFLEEFLDELRESIEWKINLRNYMLYDDPIYLEVEKNAKKLRKQEPLIDAAFEKAWEQRHYLIKRFIRENLDKIQKEIFKCEGNDEGQYCDDGLETDHSVQATFLKKYAELYLPQKYYVM